MQKRIQQQAAMAILLAPGLVYAQAAPEAGRILESNKPPALIAPLAPSAKMVPDSAPPMTARDAGTGRVMVRAFTIEGASALPQSALLAVVAPYAGRELTFNELTQAAAAVSAYYRSQGYFLASAYLPAQDLARGVVTLRILEGRVSDLRVNAAPGVRLQPAYQRRYLDALVKTGVPVSEDALERALLLSQDLPGMKANASLGPGAALGDTAIDIALTEGPLLSGSLGLDNSSNRYTGRTRLTSAVNLNDLGGYGGLASLQGATTGKHFNYARLGYVAPLGDMGTRVGVAYSRLRYELGADFASLNAFGTADVAQFTVAHPLVRSRNLSVQLRAGFENKRYENSANGVQTADKTVRSIPLGYDVSARDEILGGGTINFSMEMTAGEVDLSRNFGSQAADNAGARTEGRYGRANYQLMRFQRATEAVSMLFKLTGQIASKNLEAGEKMSLGGADRVRAYPSGEASGDEGQVLSVEGRYGLPSIRSELSLFADYGHVKLNRQVYPGALDPAGPGNSYSLKGVGAGIQWVGPWRTSVQVQVATKIGSNPARGTSGKDVDGSASRTRAWFQVASYF